MPCNLSAKYFSIAISTLIAICIAAPSQADIINVPDPDNGILTIQDGINAAVDGDEVVVADGIYTGVGNRNIDFGGRIITVRSENGPGNCIIDCEGVRSGFIFHSGETSEAVLCGFNVRNGNNIFGGGLEVTNSSPTIKNMIFDLCSATFGGAMSFNISNSIVDNVQTNGCTAEFGGGTYFTQCNLAFFNLTANGCTATAGGAGFYGVRSTVGVQASTITFNTVTNANGNGAGALLNNCDATFVNSNFCDNMTPGLGAGIATTNGSIVNVNNSALCGNSAGVGGGAYIGPNCTATFTNVNFDADSADSFGGACTADGADVIFNDCELRNCESGQGGGACATSSGSSIEARNCNFINNVSISHAESGVGDGGAMFNLGVPATIIDCTFENNIANSGGAIYNSQCNLQSTNCLFFGNTATSAGGAIYNSQSQPQIRLATMWGNSASFGGGLYNVSSFPNISNSILDHNIPEQIRDIPSSLTTVTYSNIQGGWPGDGNINQTPMFVDPVMGDFNLAPGSPCIDAGNNAAVPIDIKTDLAGNPRFVDDPDTKDTGLGDPPLVDMGPLEFQVISPCPWDLNGDGTVNTSDLLALFAQWGTPGSADFDGSGVVNTTDLLILFANWGPCK